MESRRVFFVAHMVRERYTHVKYQNLAKDFPVDMMNLSGVGQPLICNISVLSVLRCPDCDFRINC